MTQDDATNPTAMWQADYVARHLQQQASYLETLSASAGIQQAAVTAMQMLGLSAGQRVLEVGCGNGVFLPRLAEAVGPQGRVAGVDHSPEFVAEAALRARAAGLEATVSVKCASAYELPFDDATFDAGHVERVLMHLDEPTRALREMARVVRPGGVIVAAEPDWAGMRIDHGDREIFDAVYARTLHVRQPDMGLTLYRRMAEVGLVQRKFMISQSVHLDLGPWRMYGWKVEQAVEALLLEGQLPAERLRAIVPQLERASEEGTFYSVVDYHTVCGRVPD